jgi:uncharacterized damage-inducible protein DinB
MGQWEHLFMTGEFVPRARLLSGLTVEQANMRPSGLPHSIYEELWHTVKCQSSVIQYDDQAAAASSDSEPVFPEAPGNERTWGDLVTEFLAGSERAVELGRSSEALTKEVHPGETLAESLESLAVHNAYHLGKIVALRQLIGAWPPPG